MRGRATALALALALVGAGAAEARVVLYSARSGDTPESIAADYYGNRSLSLFITEGNGLPRETKLRPGQKIRIPTAFHYRVKRGDTLEGLAKKFLDDGRRAFALAGFNSMRPSEKLREGQDLLIPFQHVHRADNPESLSSVARQFYGDSSKAKMLQDFNFRQNQLLAKGDRLVVPIATVRIRAVRLQAPPPRPSSKREAQQAPPLAAAPDLEAQKREAELAAKVAAELQLAEKSYRDGNYSEVPATLDKLLAADDPSEAQLAEIFRLKAYAYTALGLDELAVSSFREVIARKPELELDAATVSPKIRAAFDRAKKATQ